MTSKNGNSANGVDMRNGEVVDAKRESLTSDRIRIVGHSPLVYWWPVWIFGLVFGTVTAFYGNQNLFQYTISGDGNSFTLMNLCFVLLIFFVVVFTNMRAEGAPAINVALLIVIGVISVYFFGGGGKILGKVPGFLVFMNSNFYFTFGVGLLLIWLFSVFVYDIRKVWVVRPGRFTEVRFPRREEGYDTVGIRLKVSYDDMICHNILGFGFMGDITVSSRDHETIVIANVFNARKKVEKALRLIATHYSQS